MQLQVHNGDGVAFGGTAGSGFHRYRARIHFAVGRRIIRQRSHRHLPVDDDVLPVDPRAKDRVGAVRHAGGSVLRMDGGCVGRIRVHYQHGSPARVRACPHGPLQPPAVHGLLIVVRYRHGRLDAGPLRRVLASAHERAHGRPRRLRPASAGGVCRDSKEACPRQAVPVASSRVRGRCLCRQLHRSRPLDFFGMDRPMDRKVLLALGHRLRQDPQ